MVISGGLSRKLQPHRGATRKIQQQDADVAE